MEFFETFDKEKKNELKNILLLRDSCTSSQKNIEFHDIKNINNMTNIERKTKRIFFVSITTEISINLLLC